MTAFAKNMLLSYYFIKLIPIIQNQFTSICCRNTMKLFQMKMQNRSDTFNLYLLGKKVLKIIFFGLTCFFQN